MLLGLPATNQPINKSLLYLSMVSANEVKLKINFNFVMIDSRAVSSHLASHGLLHVISARRVARDLHMTGPQPRARKQLAMR